MFGGQLRQRQIHSLNLNPKMDNVNQLGSTETRLICLRV
jgi:hypothetical protein